VRSRVGGSAATTSPVDLVRTREAVSEKSGELVLALVIEEEVVPAHVRRCRVHSTGDERIRALLHGSVDHTADEHATELCGQLGPLRILDVAWQNRTIEVLVCAAPSNRPDKLQSTRTEEHLSVVADHIERDAQAPCDLGWARRPLRELEENVHACRVTDQTGQRFSCRVLTLGGLHDRDGCTLRSQDRAPRSRDELPASSCP